MKTLDGHRDIVAELLDQMPDREMIKEVSELAIELGSNLKRAAQSEALAAHALTSKVECLKAHGRDQSLRIRRP